MRDIVNINKGWSFVKGLAEVPTDTPEQAERINLPHTWNGKDGQDGGADYFRGTCCYVKQISESELPVGEKIYLEINGANSSADVYWNGRCLAHHDGGYSTWRVELTKGVRQENQLCVLVDNSANEEVYPQTADFTFYGGLYRDVNLIGVPATHFDLENDGFPGIHVTPVMNGADAKVTIRADARNLVAVDRVVYRIIDTKGNVVGEQTDNPDFVITEAHLWDGRKDPYLYTAEASILRGGEVLDQVSARFGCRSFEIHPEKGFILNGWEYPLRGVARHQDRWELGNALLQEHHKEDIELICEAGFTTVRLSHYQHDRYFYDLCDEKGLVVWAEIPYISLHMSGGNDNAVQQMRELITQCYNHPSIVVWGLSNEITMGGAKDPDLLRQHRILNNLAHELDKTRLTTMACISMCGMDEEIVHIPDVVSYNHYFGWYGGNMEEYGPWFDKFHAKYPKLPIGISEYGCEALNWHNSKPESGDYSEEYQALYHESLIRQLYSRKYIWATHCWNMFDFGADARAEGGENGQNHKGLITIDRKYKKDAFYAYKAWLNPEPMIHLCGKRYIDRVEDVTKVTVYSNLPEVELFANGVSVGRKKAQDHFFCFDVPNSGETRLEAVAGDLRDESLIRKVDTMNQDYILREQGAVLNWFDITEVDGRFSLNDKVCEIMGTFRGKLWLGMQILTLVRKMNQGAPKAKPGEKKKKTTNPKLNGDLIKMIGSFTILRLTGMVGMRNVTFTKEELLKMNRQLNKIRKPGSNA